MSEEFSRNGGDSDSDVTEISPRPSGSSFRWGAVIIGLVWLLPVLVLQMLFGQVAAILMLPGIMIFFGGIALLIYGVYQAMKDARREEDGSKSTEESRNRRGRRRF